MFEKVLEAVKKVAETGLDIYRIFNNEDDKNDKDGEE